MNDKALAAQEQTQDSDTTTVRQLLGSICGSAAPLNKEALAQKLLAETRRRRWESQSPEIIAQFGLDAARDEQKIWSIMAARTEDFVCKTCDGSHCGKPEREHRWQESTITSAGEVCWQECGAKRAALIERAIAAGVPKKYLGKTFEDYVIDAENQQAVARTIQLLEGDVNGVYLYGGVGCGRTYLASLIAQERIKVGRHVVLGDVPRLLGKIKETFDDPKLSSERVIQRYCDTSLLILDDFGAGKLTQWNMGVLYQIINERYNSERATLVTSNYSLDELEKEIGVRAGDKVMAARICSRLYAMSKVVCMGERDFRKRRI